MAERRDTLPPAFARFDEIGGELEFAIFDDADGDDEAVMRVIAQVLDDPNDDPVNIDLLRDRGYRRVDLAGFLGDCCDPNTGTLIARGTHRAPTGEIYVNPTLVALDDLPRFSSSSDGIATPGDVDGEKFAYAFTKPPYSLKASGAEIQQLFDAVMREILPPGHPAEILDWISPDLPEISGIFYAGMEWWGVFLFTIYIPDLRQLTVIVGSATD